MLGWWPVFRAKCFLSPIPRLYWCTYVSLETSVPLIMWFFTGDHLVSPTFLRTLGNWDLFVITAWRRELLVSNGRGQQYGSASCSAGYILHQRLIPQHWQCTHREVLFLPQQLSGMGVIIFVSVWQCKEPRSEPATISRCLASPPALAPQAWKNYYT